MNFSASLPDYDLLQARQAYFVGIRGVGMTALATILVEAGVSVRGADVPESFVTDAVLSTLDIPIDAFEEAAISDDTDVVVFSGAHQGSKNPLVRSARERGVTCLSLAQATGLLTRHKETIAVCGVGGKSTTSALLSWILQRADFRPSYAVGVGSIPNLGRSAHWVDDTRLFVVEADEYVADPSEDVTPRFLYLQPKYVICTSLAFDHPDVYASFGDTKKAFARFLRQIPDDGLLVYNGDDLELAAMVRTLELTCRTVAVGNSVDNDIVVQVLCSGNGESRLDWDHVALQLAIPGVHNLLNAAYAATLARELGVTTSVIQAAVEEFRSTQRRFEFMGHTDAGATCYDDYAHHPREVRAAATALVDWFPEKNRVMAFQPHTFSRTKELFDEFVDVLAAVDAELWLMPIFASARETNDGSVQTEDLVKALAERGKEARIVTDIPALVQSLQGLSDNHAFLSMGAGDIYKVYDHVNLHTTPYPIS